MVNEEFKGWNKALIGAYKKGVVACDRLYETGKDQDCPYEDKRKDGGQLTWSRSFIRAWEDGFQDREKELVSVMLAGKKSTPPAHR